MAYSYNEAVNAVVEYSNKFGFPMDNDEYKRSDLDLNEIFDALDVGGKLTESIRKNHTKKYAAINIEVLTALHGRKGEKTGWAVPDSYWRKLNDIPFLGSD